MPKREFGVQRRHNSGHHKLTQTQKLQMKAPVWKAIFKKIILKKSGELSVIMIIIQYKEKERV